MKKARVIIVDDHGLVREGFKGILESTGTVEVLESLGSGEEAIAAATKHEPDVVFMDIVMRGISGIEATRWIKERNPNVKVILISSEVSRDLIREGVKAGLDGYLSKQATKETVLSALQSVLKGERYLSKEVTDVVFNDVDEPQSISGKAKNILTARETEILKHIASGKSLKEIAEELFISMRTVETHKLNIQSKLNLSNTAQLVRHAIENKII